MEFRDDLLIINVYTLPSVSFKMVDHEPKTNTCNKSYNPKKVLCSLEVCVRIELTCESRTVRLFLFHIELALPLLVASPSTLVIQFLNP